MQIRRAQACVYYTQRGTIHSNLSLCYLRLKDYAMAITHADVAMALRPGWEKGYFRHGEVAFEQRDYATALKDYEEAVKCAPNDAALNHRVKLAKEATEGSTSGSSYPAGTSASTPRIQSRRRSSAPRFRCRTSSTPRAMRAR